MKSVNMFGKNLVEQVRDESIEKSENVLDGSIKSDAAQRLANKLKHLSKEDRAALSELILLTVDSTLHNLLWLFEESPNLDIVVHDDDMKFLTEESDGLSGELHGEDGWIEKYGKYPSFY